MPALAIATRPEKSGRRPSPVDRFSRPMMSAATRIALSTAMTATADTPMPNSSAATVTTVSVIRPATSTTDGFDICSKP